MGRGGAGWGEVHPPQTPWQERPPRRRAPDTKSVAEVLMGEGASQTGSFRGIKAFFPMSYFAVFSGVSLVFFGFFWLLPWFFYVRPLFFLGLIVFQLVDTCRQTGGRNTQRRIFLQNGGMLGNWICTGVDEGLLLLRLAEVISTASSHDCNCLRDSVRTHEPP